MNRPISKLAAYLREYDRVLIDGTKQSIHDLAESIVLKTPVDTGNLRANWNPSVDAPDFTVKPFDQDSGSGVYAPQRSAGSDRAMNRVRQMLKRAVGAVFHLSNGTDYAADIEYFGKSPQARPAGMVRQTKVLYRRIMQNAFADTLSRRTLAKIDKLSTRF